MSNIPIASSTPVNMEIEKDFPRICTKCKRTLKREYFYFDKKGKRSGYCRECQRAYSTQRHIIFNEKKKKRIQELLKIIS